MFILFWLPCPFRETRTPAVAEVPEFIRGLARRAGVLKPRFEVDDRGLFIGPWRIVVRRTWRVTVTSTDFFKGNIECQ